MEDNKGSLNIVELQKSFTISILRDLCLKNIMGAHKIQYCRTSKIVYHFNMRDLFFKNIICLADRVAEETEMYL
jgi:hypothetical protein